MFHDLQKVFQTIMWLGSPLVRASDLRLNSCEFYPRPPHAVDRLVLGWVTVFDRVCDLGT